MRPAVQSRICRAPVFSSLLNSAHPKHQRLISATCQITQHFAYDVPEPDEPTPLPSNPSPSPPRPRLLRSAPQPAPPPPPQESAQLASAPVPNVQSSKPVKTFRTAGPSGSPDYIPRKRGYAPGIPIPARKFNIIPKPRKPRQPPSKTAPDQKYDKRMVKTAEIEYDRQLAAMRRGYVKWRYNQLQEKSRIGEEAKARPPPPHPAPFVPPFAEQMSSPSFGEQRELEKILFGQIYTKGVEKKQPAYMSPKHQKKQEAKRRALMRNYLALYHTSRTFITTHEELDLLIESTLLSYTGYATSHPQSYAEILRDLEIGWKDTSIADGYVPRISKEREDDIFDTVRGTVADNKPGLDEVLPILWERIKEAETRAEEGGRATAALSEETETAEEEPLLEPEVTEETPLADSRVEEPAVEEEKRNFRVKEKRLLELAESAPTSISEVLLLEQEPHFLPQPEMGWEETSTEIPSDLPQDLIGEPFIWASSEPELTKEQKLLIKIERLRQEYHHGYLPSTNMLDGIFTNPSTKPDRTPLEFPSYLHEKRRPNQTMRDPQSVLKLVESADLPAPISPEQLLAIRKRSKPPNFFPELDAVDEDNIDGVEYFMKRARYELQHPSGSRSVFPNAEKWKNYALVRPEQRIVTQTKVTQPKEVRASKPPDPLEALASRLEEEEASLRSKMKEIGPRSGPVEFGLGRRWSQRKKGKSKSETQSESKKI